MANIIARSFSAGVLFNVCEKKMNLIDLFLFEGYLPLPTCDVLKTLCCW